MTINPFNAASKAMWAGAFAAQDRVVEKSEFGFSEALATKGTTAVQAAAPAIADGGSTEPDRLPFRVDGEEISELPVVPEDEGPSSEVLLTHKLFFGNPGYWMQPQVSDPPVVPEAE